MFVLEKCETIFALTFVSLAVFFILERGAKNLKTHSLLVCSYGSSLP